ncbi:hypothetical protein HPB49_005683 [Dermacentor silvarum]|uniref:Uncharacterized protein n=1 Tax=Dermacentor silvarum TaxID=543639 RepID=A0ACB8DW30_DERSI|nr:hypothetical protein HPB49_005683 [Dermacentor silvarum]
MQGSPANDKPWDPLVEESAVPSLQCLKRIRKELAHFYADPPARVFISADEEDLTKVHALIVGSPGTPYVGGFFYFLIRFPADYPMSPPRVRLMTTDDGRVRFNVNLYANGKEKVELRNSVITAIATAVAAARAQAAAQEHETADTAEASPKKPKRSHFGDF